MVKCEVCDGRGYVITNIDPYGEEIKVWCEKCCGRGKYGYEGDRTKWEGE